MSEYTNYYAVQSAAQDIGALSADLSGVLPDALVFPNSELFQSLVDEGRHNDLTPEVAALAWQKTPRPAWVVLGRDTPDHDADMAALAQLGPAIHVDVQEDGVRWKIHLMAGDVSWAVMVADARWRSGWIPEVDEPLFQAGTDGVGDGIDAISARLKIDPLALRAALIPDGAMKIRRILGVPAPHIFDQRIMARRIDSVRMIHDILPF